MNSPADEITATESQGRPAATPEPLRSEAEHADFGPDEERLVRQARAEALLRLARAL